MPFEPIDSSSTFQCGLLVLVSGVVLVLLSGVAGTLLYDGVGAVCAILNPRPKWICSPLKVITTIHHNVFLSSCPASLLHMPAVP